MACKEGLPQVTLLKGAVHRFLKKSNFISHENATTAVLYFLSVGQPQVNSCDTQTLTHKDRYIYSMACLFSLYSEITHYPPTLSIV